MYAAERHSRKVYADEKLHVAFLELIMSLLLSPNVSVLFLSQNFLVNLTARVHASRASTCFYVLALPPPQCGSLIFVFRGSDLKKIIQISSP
jgi:hypothetical protein